MGSDALLLNDEAIVDGVWVSDGMVAVALMSVDKLAELRSDRDRRTARGTWPPWNWERYCQASDDASGLVPALIDITGFHSVGS
jgi:hypothetical protein